MQRKLIGKSVGAKKRVLAVVLVFTLIFAAIGAVYCQKHSVSTKREQILGLPAKTVVLTIDDGPDPRFTPKILSLLEKYHAHATFFVIGDHAVQYPELVQQEVAAGHEIGNHTMTHLHLEDVDAATVQTEITMAQQTLQAITGTDPSWFRPPRGWLSPAAQKVVDAADLRRAYWTFCLEHHDSPTPQMMAERAYEKIQHTEGAILLMHDGVLDRTRSIQALEILLEDLQRDGYRVISLQEALSNPGAKFALSS